MTMLSPANAEMEHARNAIAGKMQQLRLETDRQRRWLLQRQIEGFEEDLQRLVAGPSGRRLRGEDAVWSVSA